MTGSSEIAQNFCFKIARTLNHEYRLLSQKSPQNHVRTFAPPTIPCIQLCRRWDLYKAQWHRFGWSSVRNPKNWNPGILVTQGFPQIFLRWKRHGFSRLATILSADPDKEGQPKDGTWVSSSQETAKSFRLAHRGLNWDFGILHQLHGRYLQDSSVAQPSFLLVDYPGYGDNRLLAACGEPTFRMFHVQFHRIGPPLLQEFLQMWMFHSPKDLMIWNVITVFIGE